MGCNTLEDPKFIVCYTVNYLMSILIKYNSLKKEYFNENDAKFIKLKADSLKLIYFIRDIIRNFNIYRKPSEYVQNFEECFDEYLSDKFFVYKSK